MTDQTATISLDRSGMPGSLGPLVFSAALDDVELGLLDYQPPSPQMMVTYAPDGNNVHGSEPNGARLQQAILGWDWCREGSTETELQAARAEVAAALAQFKYLITTQVGDAPAEVWSADASSLTISPRTYPDLVDPGTVVYAANVPVYPIPGSA